MSLAWSGQFNFELGEARQWEIGPLKVTAQRLAQEWWLHIERDNTFDELSQEAVVSSTSIEVDEEDFANRERFGFRQTSEQLSLLPALADRSVIIKPTTTLSILPGEAVTVYAGILLWLKIAVGEPPQTLKELPFLVPSDTWFGPSTIEGELCYASRSNARLNLDNLPARPHRAVTQIHIDNQANRELVVDRLSLPVPYFSLFKAADDRFWTQAVTLTNSRDTGLTELNLESTPSAEANQPTLISEPRLTSEKNMLIRAFGSFFRA